MLELRYGCRILTRNDMPSNLLKVLSDCKGERTFIIRRDVHGGKETSFVDELITAVLCFMFQHETRGQEFPITEIAASLELSHEDAGRALMFLYVRGLVKEIDYDNGMSTYQLTQRGLDLASGVFSLEERNQCKWKVGLAVDDESDLLVPILLSPNPFVLFENRLKIEGGPSLPSSFIFFDPSSPATLCPECCYPCSSDGWAVRES